MDYLVTGGCGFIGAHLSAALLAQGHQVTILDNLSSGRRERCAPGARLVVGDVRDSALLATLMQEVDGCFHLASIASVSQCNADWLGATQVNVLGTIALLQAAAQVKRPLPVLLASSAAVYGSADEFPLREDALVSPISSYGADKLACEQYARVAWQQLGVPTASLRMFNVYGPGQSTASSYCGVIQHFIEDCAKGRPLTIRGDGEQTRDFIYIDDAVRILIDVMAQPALLQGYVLNICTGSETSVNELAQQVSQLMQHRPPVEYAPPRTDDIRRSVGSPARLFAGLGARSFTPMQQGLAETIRHWSAER